jgi:hypothetical protein
VPLEEGCVVLCGRTCVRVDPQQDNHQKGKNGKKEMEKECGVVAVQFRVVA